jgi:hypothetical protein
VRRFNAPPGWPPPPNVRWRPPKRWGPDDSWPPAPPGWNFWVNEDGRRVMGPFGRYGGPSLVWPMVGLVLVVLMLFGVGKLFGGDDGHNDVAVPAASTPRTAQSTAEPTETDSESTSPDPSDTATTSEPTTLSDTPSPSQAPSPGTPGSTPTQASSTPGQPSAAPVRYRNCGAVRAAGKAPLLRGQPGYEPRLDPDHDGIACARGRDGDGN